MGENGDRLDEGLTVRVTNNGYPLLGSKECRAGKTTRLQQGHFGLSQTAW
jgi:hypothetical protein